MIYFTDLDRTLIYSKKFICRDIDEVPIERYKGEYISYMTNKSIESIKNIIKKHIVVPTTTRTIEQYNRIEFNEKDINFIWAIVCNGGHILYKGEPLKLWEDKVLEELKKSFDFNEVREKFKEWENNEGVIKVREVEKLFFYGILDVDKYKEESLDVFKEYLLEAKWNVYRTGRKIYFLPDILQKEKAVKFLCEYLNYERYNALGDSIMDLNMLKRADKAYIPNGSYVYENYKSNSFFISENIGLKGGEEILKNIDND